MANEAFWNWLSETNLTPDTDPNYYISGDAKPFEYSNAIATAFNNSSPGSDLRIKLIDDLFTLGVISANSDKNYWYSGTQESVGADFDNLKNAATNLIPESVGGDTGISVSDPSTSGPGASTTNAAFWKWLSDTGLTPDTDPNYYASGDANPDEYSTAIATAYNNSAPGSELRVKLIDDLFSLGVIDPGSDKDYWYNGTEESLGTDFGNLKTAALKLDFQAGGEDIEVKALPKNSRLVNVNGEWRVIWDLEDGLGYAWYSIDEPQLINLYGDDWQSYNSETFGTVDAYNAKYGDFYWGNVAEIDIASDNPWDDLKNRTFAAFGYVAGFDDPEVKRLILQGFFESWTPNEFLANYQNTEFYKSTTQVQRAWSQFGPEEQAQKIQAQAALLVEEYRSQYGIDPIGGISNEQILVDAEAIASGQISQSEWSYNTKRAAEAITDSPAARSVENEIIAQGASEVTIENRGGYAQERWEYWMGSTPLPPNFVNEWGTGLYMNQKSEADLETALRELSGGTWENKPENLGWSEWASPAKANIRNLLELTSVDDTDALLNNILDNGLSGQEAVLAIRQDSRFRGTNRMFDELSQAANSIGKSFGFVA